MAPVDPNKPLVEMNEEEQFRAMRTLYERACQALQLTPLPQSIVSDDNAEDVAKPTEGSPRNVPSLAAEPVKPHGRSTDDAQPLPSVDFGIVTALPIELDACLSHINNVSKVTFEQGDSRTYYRGSVSLAQNASYQIVATLLPRMGNVEAALATNDLIHLWRPRYVLMVGIAGGVSPSKQALGDVVISETIFYYESAKVAHQQEARPRVLQADALLYDRALNLRSQAWPNAIPAEVRRPDGSDRAPALHFGPIASGEKVIADGRAVEYLQSLQRKLVAIEMEGAGVAAAAIGAVQHVGFPVVRGLCDFADAAKNDSWQPYAANCAATFAFELLKSKPISPRSQALQQEQSRVVLPQAPRIDRAVLFRGITDALDMEEFKTFCFLLEIDVDEIPGDRKSSKVRELIRLFERRQKLDLLETTLAGMLQT
jgi:nucleoside phosphorylase